jgi:hypothetical protein
MCQGRPGSFDRIARFDLGSPAAGGPLTPALRQVFSRLMKPESRARSGQIPLRPNALDASAGQCSLRIGSVRRALVAKALFLANGGQPDSVGGGRSRRAVAQPGFGP